VTAASPASCRALYNFCQASGAFLKSWTFERSALSQASYSDALLPFDLRSPSSGDAGRHLKSMQKRTCRRGTIEFAVFSRLEYSIFLNS
jgi:hypothetical protein